MNTAVFPGSFDPVTAGHLDIVERAAAIFDRVIVCVMVNAEKRPLFSLEERLRFLRDSIAHIPNASAGVCEGLLADFARQNGAHTLVKGARGCADFENELQMAQINRRLWPALDTVILPAKSEHLHISSTMVREMLRYRQPLDSCVPAGGLAAIRAAAEGKV